ncbi:ankyrin repeat-containing domain protein [Mycena capillaripes]|nr:ankyrin repeat-containing domain protein [Mycena capillaripes]
MTSAPRRDDRTATLSKHGEKIERHSSTELKRRSTLVGIPTDAAGTNFELSSVLPNSNSQSMNHLDELPPELISLIPASLSTASLGALVVTCRRLHAILQSELDSRITPEVGHGLLLWAAASKPHVVRKLLSPPHSVKPNGYGLDNMTPLHVAAKAGNIEITELLLVAGADPAETWDAQCQWQPLHYAAINKHLAVMKLLLDHNAPVDTVFGSDGYHESALHFACSQGHVETVKFLLEHGAHMEREGHFGTALGFAVHSRQLEIVEFLLAKGADASVTYPQYVLLDGGAPYPHRSNLLYIAMGLRQPSKRYRTRPKRLTGAPKWEGLPLPAEKKRLMSILLAHGASKENTLETISTNVVSLALEAKCTEDEYLAVVKAMLQEAEDG